MKVFISQPMKFKDDILIKNERKTIEKYVSSEIGDHETVNPLLDKKKYTGEGDRGSLLMLAESIRQMARADVAYFPKVIYQTRGCDIELKCALGYGLRIAFYPPDKVKWE